MTEELNDRDTFLKIVRRQGVGIVPCDALFYPGLWDEVPGFFETLKEEAPNVCVTMSRADRAKQGHERDPWGCLWHYPGNYLAGQVEEHPLDDWADLKSYQPPKPEQHWDWAQMEKDVAQAHENGLIAMGTTDHGFIYLRLTYLRGFQNFMLDIAEQRKEIHELRDMVTEYWIGVVRKWVDLGVDIVSFGDDLGHQNSLPISPAAWREFFKPAFEKVFNVCRRQNVEVSLHTDGYIVDIIPDLLDIGVTILNPQDLVNGLDNLQRIMKGNACTKLDIDRQKITVFGTPEEIDAHIEKCVRMMGSPDGGLTLIYGAYPGTPAENARQVVLSMEKHHRMWADE